VSTAAVAYAAKSTADPRGSIRTQLVDCRDLAERDGLDLVAEYHDEAASAFKGNRGPGLASAMAECERLAVEHGSCALVVQHSDRLARGDVQRAAHLIEYRVWALKHDVMILSVQDPQTFPADTSMTYTALMGDRNHEDSARKSAATRDGLRRRAERGAPVGAIPLGFRVEPTVVDGQVITRRVIDDDGAVTVQRIFDLIARGHTPGQVARVLNIEGRPTTRGKTWNARPVRRLVTNRCYLGEQGYPALISTEAFAEAQAQLTRMDPVAVQTRKGGRRPPEDYLLRGIATCSHCGRALYTRRLASGRHYLCGNVREARGTCHAAAIPAEVAEQRILDHLYWFIGDIEAWLSECAAERDSEREKRIAAVGRERAALADLDAKRERRMAEYERMLDAGDPKARYALEAVERVDAERDDQAGRIAYAEANAAEHDGSPDLDGALDFYNELVAFVRGKVSKAHSASDLNATLRAMVAEIRIGVCDGQLRADFRFAGETLRINLPELPEWGWPVDRETTGTQTFV
jgi:DNA invertase Pin-like site-specific DNA recombinase